MAFGGLTTKHLGPQLLLRGSVLSLIDSACVDENDQVCAIELQRMYSFV